MVEVVVAVRREEVKEQQVEKAEVEEVQWMVS